MNKEQYLKVLSLNLKNVPKQDVDDILQYYEEYFSDAGVENESKVIEELGNPMALANKLKAEAVLESMEKSENKKTDNKLSILWILVVAVCTSPVWFPIGIVAASIIFAVIVTVFSVLGAFAVASLSIMVAGIISVGAGFLAIPSGVANALYVFGIGILLVGGGSLCAAILFMLMKLIYGLIVKICKALIRKKGDKNE